METVTVEPLLTWLPSGGFVPTTLLIWSAVHLAAAPFGPGSQATSSVAATRPACLIFSLASNGLRPTIDGTGSFSVDELPVFMMFEVIHAARPSTATHRIRS